MKLAASTLAALAAVTFALASSEGAAQTPSRARMDTTGDLADLCAGGSEFCYGFITGAGQLYEVMVAAGRMDAVACSERTPTLEQVRVAFVDWVGADPARRREKPIDGLWRAAAATWPCP